MVSRYRRLLGPIVRGRLGIAVATAVFLVGAWIGGNPGVAVGAVWVLVSGSYCLANFWWCREAHCLVTGAGWSALGLAAIAAVSMSDGGLGWLRLDVVVIAYLVVLGASYCFEGLVAARTGRHFLGAGSDHAEAR